MPRYLHLIGTTLLLAIVLAACRTEVQVTPTPADGMGGVANPAAVACREQGHTYEIRTAATGDQYGVCRFEDGSECDAWAYYRGECAPGQFETAPTPSAPAINIVRAADLADTVRIDVLAADSAESDPGPLVTITTIEDRDTITRLLDAVNLDLPPRQPADCPTETVLRFVKDSGEAVEIGYACPGVTPAFLRGGDDLFDGQDVIVPEPFRELLAAKSSAQVLPSGTVTFEDVQFVVGDAVAAAVSAETAPAYEFMGTETIPSYTQFTFEAYAATPSVHVPTLSIYPIAEFDTDPGTALQISTALQQFLAQQPAAADEIPFLPLFNAGQQLRSQIDYLDFNGGRGVRFLTQYAQDVWPINNTDLFYTFQGITDDGQYYVSAVLPVSHPLLPQESAVEADADYQAFVAGYDAYISEMTRLLDSQPADSFTPDLSDLDAMITSLSIGGESVATAPPPAANADAVGAGSEGDPEPTPTPVPELGDAEQIGVVIANSADAAAEFRFVRQDGVEFTPIPLDELVRRQLADAAWRGNQVALAGSQLDESTASFTVSRLTVLSGPSQEPRNLTAYATVNASSQLPADLAGTYHGWSATDGDAATAWVEGVAGPGIGEWIQLDFPEAVIVSAIGINPGYDASAELFEQNHRVKALTLQFIGADGAVTDETIALADARGVQQLTLDAPQSARAIRFIIDDYAPGSLYDDTAIAEIEVYAVTQ